MVPREVLAPSSPALQAGARAISAIEGQMVCRAKDRTGTPQHGVLGPHVSACSPPGRIGAPKESNSHAFRAAVFEAAASADLADKNIVHHTGVAPVYCRWFTRPIKRAGRLGFRCCAARARE